jgi:hypothetical protein
VITGGFYRFKRFKGFKGFRRFRRFNRFNRFTRFRVQGSRFRFKVHASGFTLHG